MKCSIMLHFIKVFSVCKSAHLGVSIIQRVNLLTALHGFYIDRRSVNIDLRSTVLNSGQVY